MERLHSSSTYYRKYIMPFWVITIGSISVFSLNYGQNYYMPATVVVFMILLLTIYVRYFYALRFVYLDKEKKEFVIKYEGKKIPVAFADVKHIRTKWVSTAVITLQLEKHYAFGNTFSFAPKAAYFRWNNSIAKCLKKTINASR